jgi:WD40 repeat protein
LNKAMPAELETILLKAMAKIPAERFATAQELADDLRRFIEDKPIKAKRPSLRQRAAKWARRHKAVVRAALVVVVLAMVALAISTFLILSAYERAVTHLYHSLVGQAQAIRRAREIGYRGQVWNLLKQALQLQTADRNLMELRNEAVACMGDFVGLEPTTWRGFPAEIKRIALHPDSLHLAVGLADGTVLVCNIATGKEITLPQQHGAAVVSIAIRSDGKSMASADLDGNITLWQPDPVSLWACTTTIKITPPQAMIADEPPTVTVALSPRGRTLVYCSSDESTVSVRNSEAGIPGVPFSGREGDQLYALTFNHDGSLLAAAYARGGSYGILVWDTGAPQKPIAELPCKSGGMVSHLAFSPDGRFLAAAVMSLEVVLYQTSDFKRYLFVGGDLPAEVAWSPDSQLVALNAVQQGLIRLWNISSNREGPVLEAPASPGLHSVVLSRDGNHLIAASKKEVRIWDIAGASENVNRYGHVGGVPRVAFSPDGTLLASTGKDQKVKIWNPATGQLRTTLDNFKGAVETIGFSSDGKWLATGDWSGAIRIWDVETRRELLTLEHELGTVIWELACSPDGRLFAACGENGVTLWRVSYRDATGGIKARLSMENPTRLSVSYSMGLCFSADSGLLAWGEKQGVTLRLWDLVHARPHPVPPAAKLIQSSRSMAFHPKSNHLVFIGPSLVPECWDVVAGQRAISFGGKEPARGSEADLSGALVREGGIGWGSTIALSADGIWLAQAGSSVRIWDLDKKELLLVLPEERSQPWCLAWSPDRSQLAVASSDGSLVIWNMPKIRLQLAEIGLGW